MRLLIRDIENPAKRVEIDAPRGEKLSRAIWLSGRLAPVPLCGGLALCGRCAARLNDPPPPLEEERRYFSEAELTSGWRLTCRGRVEKDQVIFLPPDRFRDEEPINISSRSPSCCLAIDLGTTTLEWRALAREKTIAYGKTLNPQAGAGADIISRLSAARLPDSPLADLALAKISNIIDSLEDRDCEVKRLCIAANSAMTEILLRKDISGLCAAPYSLSYAGDEILDLDFGTRSLPAVIPPLLSPFIGGDAACALLACVTEHIPEPFLLADLGTNAEFMLLTKGGELFAASAPMGPALEGVGPACGGMAAPGAVVAYTLTPKGLEESLFASGGVPKIGATGYLSLLAILSRLGLMSREGRLIRSFASPMAEKLAERIFRPGDLSRVILPRKLYLDASDIELALKAKATFSLSIKNLLDAADLSPDEIQTFCLAGALGAHVNIVDLVDLGFIPASLGERARSLPSAALDGASVLALYPERLNSLDELLSRANIVSLADDDKFLNAYLDEMRWIY